MLDKPIRKQIQIDPKDEKDVIWWPEKLKETIRDEWPLNLRKDVGFQLGRVQQGLDPDNYRPMPSIGSGVREIKLQDENKSQYRVIYIAKFEEGIYVFHVITKKSTENTTPQDLAIAKTRLSEIIAKRNQSRRK